MQFMVLAYDGTDEKALDRRLKVRTDHVAKVDELVASGNVVMGAALMDEERMIGSVMIVDFPTRADVDDWLETEPYVTGGVWEKIDVIPCQVGPSFTKYLDVITNSSS